MTAQLGPKDLTYETFGLSDENMRESSHPHQKRPILDNFKMRSGGLFQ